MIALAGLKKCALPLLLLAALSVSACGMSSSYRPASQKTIRDFAGSSNYRKKVGVIALSNTTLFVSDQVAAPFMNAFLSSMESAVSDADLVIPGQTEAAPFLWNPPRIANGDIDVFTLAGLAREEGMNHVVSPILMDIRVRKRNTGFWFFKDVAYSLQIQTAAAIYDAITGARLALGILTDEVEIDEYQAGVVSNGQETQVDDLIELAEEMGEALGAQMGNAIENNKWLASVVAVEDGVCVIMAGSEVGIEAGDRFTVIEGSGILTGLDGQRYILPGVNIGEIIVSRVAPRQSFGAPESGETPPIGSILVPGN
jgi:hypothetical protein